jgi:hypothetical protein
MKLKLTLQFFLSAICVLLLLACVPTTAVAGNVPDTPEKLMAKGRAFASQEQAAARLMDRLFTSLASQRSFAAALIDGAQKGDKDALAKVIASKLGVTPSQVTVEEVDRDILIRGTIKLKGGTVISYCVDTEGKRCGGHGFSVGIAGD